MGRLAALEPQDNGNDSGCVPFGRAYDVSVLLLGVLVTKKGKRAVCVPEAACQDVVLGTHDPPTDRHVCVLDFLFDNL